MRIVGQNLLNDVHKVRTLRAISINIRLVVVMQVHRFLEAVPRTADLLAHLWQVANFERTAMLIYDGLEV